MSVLLTVDEWIARKKSHLIKNEGLSEGAASRLAVGTAAHWARQADVSKWPSPDALSRHAFADVADEAPDDEVVENEEEVL